MLNIAIEFSISLVLQQCQMMGAFVPIINYRTWGKCLK